MKMIVAMGVACDTVVFATYLVAQVLSIEVFWCSKGYDVLLCNLSPNAE